MALQHTVPVLKVDMLAPSCDRCGKDFKAKRKNCYNCGVQVCKDCSSFKTRLPQFGYTKPVRCCGYCSHFLYVYKMDDAALAKLNIKTLKRYLASYNISTHGMLEKQELIKAIQENRPLPEASEIYFRQNTPDTVEKSTRMEEEIYSTSSHLPQGSGEERFWDLDKFFAKLFGNDDVPPRPPQRPEPTSTYAQRPQTAPQDQSHQQQPQSQPQPQFQPTKQGPFNFTQQPQPQPCQQQQYGYPPMPTPQPGATPHQAMPNPGTHPYAPPTGAAPTFFPAGSPSPNQGYYTAYPPGVASEQGGYSTLNGHTQYQKQPFAQGGQPNCQSTNAQYNQNNHTYYQQTYQQYPPQEGQQQHPFAHFQQGTSYYKTQSQPQPQVQPQAQQHQYRQQYNQNQHFHNQHQQQHSHYTQQPQPAPYPASSTSSSSTSYAPNTTYGSNNSQGSQSKPQATPPKPTPQAAPQPQPTPQATPRPTSTPQATSQPTRPTSTSRPVSSSTAPETPRPQATSRPASSTSSQSRPVPSTPESPRRGPRAPQDRNDYSTFGSESGSTPYSSTHSRQGSTAPESSETPPTSSSTSSRPPRQSNRGPQTEHSASLLTIEEIVSENVDPSTLSIKVIKSLLDTNFVSYVGVVEKSDLVGQLQKLMISTRAEQVRVFNEQEAARKQSEQQEQRKQQQEQQEHHQQQQKASSTGSDANGGGKPLTTDDENLCKVCLEASLNCVMLNCGHMSTCMECGKKIMEGSRVCPICREYIVKLLHVFRA